MQSNQVVILYINFHIFYSGCGTAEVGATSRRHWVDGEWAAEQGRRPPWCQAPARNDSAPAVASDLL